MNSRHSSGFTSVPVAIMSTVTAMRGEYSLRKAARVDFGVLAPFGDLAAELVALAELLPDGLDDVVRVAVGLGEDQGLGKLLSAGKYLRPIVTEGANDGAYLVGVHDRAVELRGGVDSWLVWTSQARAVCRSRFSTSCSALMVSPLCVISVSIR